MAIARIMCFGNANKDDPDAKKSREIEKQLREDQKRMAKEVKLLLLGKEHPAEREHAGRRCSPLTMIQQVLESLASRPC